MSVSLSKLESWKIMKNIFKWLWNRRYKISEFLLLITFYIIFMPIFMLICWGLVEVLIWLR